MFPQVLQEIEVHADAWENTGVSDFLPWKIRPVVQWQLSLASELQSVGRVPPEDDWALRGE